jgi:hypothetical protein
MGFKVKATAKGQGEGGAWELPPEGNHAAQLVALIDLGTHLETYEGKPSKKHKVYLAWELVEEPRSDGQGNHVVCEEYTLSFNENAKLRSLVGEWLNVKFKDEQEFDLTGLFKRPCLLTVKHVQGKKNPEKTYYRVGNAAKPTKGMTVKPASWPQVVWDFESKSAPPSEDWLPYLRGLPVAEKVRESDEWKARFAGGGSKPLDDAEGGEEEVGAAAGAGDADDIGF